MKDQMDEKTKFKNRERERERTLFYKDCSLGSARNLSNNYSAC